LPASQAVFFEEVLREDLLLIAQPPQTLDQVKSHIAADQWLPIVAAKARNPIIVLPSRPPISINSLSIAAAV